MNQAQFEIQQHDLSVLINEHGESLKLSENGHEKEIKALVHQVNGAPDWVRGYRQRDETSWFVMRVLGTTLPDGVPTDNDELTTIDELGTKFTVQDFKPIGRPFEGKFVGYLLAMTTNVRLGGL